MLTIILSPFADHPEDYGCDAHRNGDDGEHREEAGQDRRAISGGAEASPPEETKKARST